MMGERGWGLRRVRGWVEGVGGMLFLRNSAPGMLRTMHPTVRMCAEKSARPNTLRGDTNSHCTLSPLPINSRFRRP